MSPSGYIAKKASRVEISLFLFWCSSTQRGTTLRSKRVIVGCSTHDLLYSFKGAHDEKPLFSATKSLFKIRRAVEVVEKRRNHCIVFLELDAHPDPEKPNITEFQIMLQIMKNRDWERKSCWQLKDKVVSMHKKVHNVVPVSTGAYYITLSLWMTSNAKSIRSSLSPSTAVVKSVYFGATSIKSLRSSTPRFSTSPLPIWPTVWMILSNGPHQ